jgi:hypothetical protein
MASHDATAAASMARKAALAVASVFALVGVLGFIPGITSSYEEMALAGHGSEAMLLGIFQVSILHNIVHLLFAVAGFLLARTESGARYFLVGGGAIYLVLWLYGLVIGEESSANLVPVNSADNWLHLLLGVGMLALGLLLRGRTPVGRATPRTDHP